MELYDFAVLVAKKVTELRGKGEDWTSCFFELQRILCCTPLRIFLPTLVYDEQLPIRVGAKGGLADHTGEYRDDSEVRAFAEAEPCVVMSIESKRSALRGEVRVHPILDRTLRTWHLSTINMRLPPDFLSRSEPARHQGE